MPLHSYGVLKGKAIEVRLGAGQSPHFQVRLVDDTTDYRIAVNVKSQPLALSNKGGVVTLVDENGLKVHGVAYTREQARHPGWTLVF